MIDGTEDERVFPVVLHPAALSLNGQIRSTVFNEIAPIPLSTCESKVKLLRAM